MKRIFTIVACFLCSASAIVFAQTGYLTTNGECDPTWISPNYFGPNAFPVPDMLKCTTGKLEVEVGATGSLGRLTPTNDYTLSADLRVRVPLWTDRVNLSVWVQAWEWYWDNARTREVRRVSPEEPLTGNLQGDFYFSVDMLVLRENDRRPAITARAACKSASGGHYKRARYYDAPGYFMDACVSKNFRVGGDFAISAAASAGFLCWQVDNGRQNDAVMYEVSVGVKSKPINFAADFGGYVGWKNDGDKPMTLKIRADIIPGSFVSPFIAYQRGFMDWPFDQLKAGVTFSIGILKDRKY